MAKANTATAEPTATPDPYSAEDVEIVETRATKDDPFTAFADNLIPQLEVGSRKGKAFNTQPGDKKSTIRNKLNVAAAKHGVRVRCIVKDNDNGTFRFEVRALELKTDAPESE